MSTSWKRDREQLFAWVESRQSRQKEQKSAETPWGNLIAIGSVVLIGVLGASYYANYGSEDSPSLESKLHAQDEEIDVEEEYRLLDE